MHRAYSHAPPNLVPVRRALLSVSDKSGIVDFARRLDAMGVDLISTGGTARTLAEAGLRVTPIEQVTGFPEMMDGRVKTLHPMVHAALLAVRDDPAHAAALRDHGIVPIDLVCINLYPFERTISQPEVTLAEAIENIDIGGPSMVRSAAKNADYVAVVTDPAQYAAVVESLRQNDGSLPLDLRRRLASEAFALTAGYDTLIAAHLRRQLAAQNSAAPDAPEPAGTLPAGFSMPLVLRQSLRYGENPHQSAALYTLGPGASGIDLGSGIPQARQLHGKELSYNNINDAAAALWLAAVLASLAAELSEPGRPKFAACVIKHANPCGAALGGSALDAISEGIAGDPLAAYGGIVAVSGTVDLAAAERLCAADVFLEVLVAPQFAPEAFKKLTQRWANLRILQAPGSAWTPRPAVDVRSVPGGVLAQERDNRLASPAEFTHAAGPPPSESQRAIARFLEPVCRALTSNAVCIGGPSTDHPGAVRLLGAGAGQMDRIAACRLAAEKAGPHARGAVAYSDAFFPFPDGPQVLIDAGVSCIVHPGGSKRDQETLDLCAARGVTCLVSGLRHFRH